MSNKKHSVIFDDIYKNAYYVLTGKLSVDDLIEYNGCALPFEPYSEHREIEEDVYEEMINHFIETEEYENGYQQYLEDNKLKDTVENKAEYTMSLEQNDSGLTENSSNAGTTTTTSKTVSGRFDTETGKTYINDKEVSADEYNVFANMSMKEKVQKYGQTEGLSTSVNTSDTITPQTDKISSDNLKYNSNVNEGKQVIVMTKTKEKTKVVPVTVAV